MSSLTLKRATQTSSAFALQAAYSGPTVSSIESLQLRIDQAKQTSAGTHSRVFYMSTEKANFHCHPEYWFEDMSRGTTRSSHHRDTEEFLKNLPFTQDEDQTEVCAFKMWTPTQSACEPVQNALHRTRTLATTSTYVRWRKYEHVLPNHLCAHSLGVFSCVLALPLSYTCAGCLSCLTCVPCTSMRAPPVVAHCTLEVTKERFAACSFAFLVCCTRWGQKETLFFSRILGGHLQQKHHRRVQTEKQWHSETHIFFFLCLISTLCSFSVVCNECFEKQSTLMISASDVSFSLETQCLNCTDKYTKPSWIMVSSPIKIQQGTPEYSRKKLFIFDLTSW